MILIHLLIILFVSDVPSCYLFCYYTTSYLITKVIQIIILHCIFGVDDNVHIEITKILFQFTT